MNKVMMTYKKLMTTTMMMRMTMMKMKLEADELSNDDIQEINDNNNDDNDDNDEDETEDETEDEINDNETVTQSAKKRQRAETDEVTDITPRKRNKTNTDELTIQLDQSKYTNIKNTIRNNLTKIQQLIHKEVEMQHKPEINVKLKVTRKNGRYINSS